MANTKVKSLNEVFKYTDEQVEELLLFYWGEYCNKWTPNPRGFQAMFANTAANNYFNNQVKQKVEKFLETVQNMEQGGNTFPVSVYSNLFDEFMKNVFKNRPYLEDITRSKAIKAEYKTPLKMFLFTHLNMN